MLLPAIIIHEKRRNQTGFAPYDGNGNIPAASTGQPRNPPDARASTPTIPNPSLSRLSTSAPFSLAMGGGGRIRLLRALFMAVRLQGTEECGA